MCVCARRYLCVATATTTLAAYLPTLVVVLSLWARLLWANLVRSLSLEHEFLSVLCGTTFKRLQADRRRALIRCITCCLLMTTTLLLVPRSVMTFSHLRAVFQLCQLGQSGWMRFYLLPSAQSDWSRQVAVMPHSLRCLWLHSSQWWWSWCNFHTHRECVFNFRSVSIRLNTCSTTMALKLDCLSRYNPEPDGSFKGAFECDRM